MNSSASLFRHSGRNSGPRHRPSQTDPVGRHEECETTVDIKIKSLRSGFGNPQFVTPCKLVNALDLTSTYMLYNCVSGLWTEVLIVFLQVKCGERHQLLPDNPERFDRVVCVLGRNAISSGRHYWEVTSSPDTENSINSLILYLFLKCPSLWITQNKHLNFILFQTNRLLI